MNLHEIKELLKKSEKSVFKINEISRITGIKKNIVSVYVNRMLGKKLIFKVERNKVSLTDDPFIISSQLIFPSYISFISALYIYGYISQTIDKIYVVSPKKRKKSNFLDNEINFIKFDPKMMFGYKRISKSDGFIFIADLEKTVIDCLYKQSYCRLNYLIPVLKDCNIEKIKEYAKRLNIESINRRLGYLFDLIEKKHSFKRESNTTYKLNATIKKKGKFNKKWYLYINEELGGKDDIQK